MEDNQIKKPYIKLQIAKLGSLYTSTQANNMSPYLDAGAMNMAMMMP